jgi:hypothetical protein
VFAGATNSKSGERSRAISVDASSWKCAFFSLSCPSDSTDQQKQSDSVRLSPLESKSTSYIVKKQVDPLILDSALKFNRPRSTSSGQALRDSFRIC